MIPHHPHSGWPAIGIAAVLTLVTLVGVAAGAYRISSGGGPALRGQLFAIFQERFGVPLRDDETITSVPWGVGVYVEGPGGDTATPPQVLVSDLIWSICGREVTPDQPERMAIVIEQLRDIYGQKLSARDRLILVPRGYQVHLVPGDECPFPDLSTAAVPVAALH